MRLETPRGTTIKVRPLTPVDPNHRDSLTNGGTASDADQFKAGEAAKEQIKAWCGETTAHGIGNAVKDDRWTPYRIVWLCIFIMAIGANCWQLSTVIASYLSYPTSEVTTINTNPPDFPYVTLCNQMAPSQSREHALLQDPASHLSQYVRLIRDNREAWESYENDTGIAIEDVLLSPTGAYNNLESEEIVDIGHDLKDFVLSCTYAGIDCDLDQDFTVFMDSSFFTCYTFTGNYVTSGRDIGSGPSHGLSLVVYTESVVDGTPFGLEAFKYNKYSEIQNSMGVRLEVHGRKELPSPQDAGLDVMPGHSTNLALQATEIKKLPKPYGKCVKREYLKSVPDYKYSSARCLDECAADYVYEKCGCASAIYPLTDYILGKNYEYCAKFNNDSGMTTAELLVNIDCERSKLLKFSGDQKHREDCGCFESCDYIIYDEIVSSARWPAPIYAEDMYQQYVREHSDFANLLAYTQLNDIIGDTNRTSDTLDLIEYNFARINIYFRDVLIINIDEKATYDLGTLFSNIGGTIGLWAGLSLITLIEVGFLLFRLCRIGVQKCRGSSEMKKAKDNGESNL